MVSVFERVYEVGPVFRAEPHDTTRNLAEYVSMDVELGFIGHFRDVMALLRDVVAGMAASVRDHAPDAVQLLEIDLP
jgi:nondiscriminating aspartyl-tRNA synthetase